MELNIEQLRSWIGREETRHELVTPSLVERFNATLIMKAIRQTMLSPRF